MSLQQSSTGGAKISTGPDAQGNPPVVPGSPAARAGLQPGDLVTAINGKKISSTEQFIATVDSYSPGDTITFTIERGGKTQDVKVTLGARPQRAPTG